MTIFRRAFWRSAPETYAWGARQVGQDIRDLATVQTQARVSVACICLSIIAAVALCALCLPLPWRLI